MGFILYYLAMRSSSSHDLLCFPGCWCVPEEEKMAEAKGA